MRNAQHFVVVGEPVAKGRPKFGRGKVYTPRRTIIGEREMAEAAKAAGVQLLHTAVALHVRAYFKTPNHWSGVRMQHAENGEIRPTKRPDFDNIAKLAGDALNGICWDDDKQIATAAIEKFYSEFPRVEISYWPISGANIEEAK